MDGREVSVTTSKVLSERNDKEQQMRSIRYFHSKNEGIKQMNNKLDLVQLKKGFKYVYQNIAC